MNKLDDVKGAIVGETGTIYRLFIAGQQIDSTIKDSRREAEIYFWEKWPDTTRAALNAKQLIEIRW